MTFLRAKCQGYTRDANCTQSCDNVCIVCPGVTQNKAGHWRADGRAVRPTDWLNDLNTDWLKDSLSHWLTAWLIFSLTDWLPDWCTLCLSDWQTAGVTDWLTNRQTAGRYWTTDRPNNRRELSFGRLTEWIAARTVGLTDTDSNMTNELEPTLKDYYWDLFFFHIWEARWPHG